MQGHYATSLADHVYDLIHDAVCFAKHEKQRATLTATGLAKCVGNVPGRDDSAMIVVQFPLRITTVQQVVPGDGVRQLRHCCTYMTLYGGQALPVPLQACTDIHDGAAQSGPMQRCKVSADADTLHLQTT